MRVNFTTIFLAVLLLLAAPQAHAGRTSDLSDAITGLTFLSGAEPENKELLKWDINDNKFGLEEVAFILQYITGFRQFDEADIGQSGDLVGPQGAVLLGAEGLARLDIPPGAIASPTRVYIETRTKEGGATRSPIVHITTDPPLTGPLAKGALLSFPGAPGVSVARWMERPGQTGDAAGPTSSLAYWLPLAHSRLDVDGTPVVWLARFSEYAAVERVPSETDLGSLLDPPSTPDGLTYVGMEVVIDSVLVPELSTMPEDRSLSPDDTIQITSETVFVNGIARDIIVAHIFGSDTATDETCEVPPGMLDPPAAPDGMCYVGYDLVINHTYQDGTVPMDYVESPADLSVVQSHSEVDNHMLVCDIIVRHLFSPCPNGPDPGEGCDVFWTAELEAKVSFSMDRHGHVQHYSCQATASWGRFPIVPWDTRTGEYPLEHCYYDFRVETGWSSPCSDRCPLMESKEYVLGSCNDEEMEESIFGPAAELGIMDNWDVNLGDPDSLVLSINPKFGYYHWGGDAPMGQYLAQIRGRNAFSVDILHTPDPAYGLPEDYLAEIRVTFRPVP